MATAELHLLLVESVTREYECMLQFDGDRQTLRSWLWPKNHSGTMVEPKDLREHRASHNFLGPSCLCPALSGENTPSYVEAAMLDRGGESGFVAICSTDTCGYLVLLGRIFERGNMPTAVYPKRCDGSIQPPPVYHQSEDQDNVFGGADFKGRRLIRDTQDIEIELLALSPSRRVLPRWIRYRTLLSKLDSRVQPGIPENTMRSLFVKCHECSKVTTRRAFLYHSC